jgi:4-hydroxybenzoate polyprenyltransferase
MDQGVEPATPHGPARIPDYIFLLRPMILIPVWTFYLLGAKHGLDLSGTPIPQFPFMMGLVSFTALLGAIYIINQISDRETDLQSGKLFLLSHSIITTRAAALEAALLLSLSIALGILFMPAGFNIVLLISLGLGLAYSVEPVRLKKRPVLDVLANAVGNGVLNTLAGWTAIGAPLEGLAVLIPYPLAVASVHLTTTLADIEGDVSSGLRTSGVALGAKRGIALAVGLMAASVAAASAVDNQPAFYASLLSIPVFLIPARSSKQQHIASSILLPAKAATLIFSVTAGFFFPLYIPFLALIFLVTRLYYRNRFGMAYPGLKG